MTNQKPVAPGVLASSSEFVTDEHRDRDIVRRDRPAADVVVDPHERIETCGPGLTGGVANGQNWRHPFVHLPFLDRAREVVGERGFHTAEECLDRVWLLVGLVGQQEDVDIFREALQ